MGVSLSQDKILSFFKDGYIILKGLDSYQNKYSKLLIKCDNGHEYESCLDTYRKGHRCKLCRNKSASLPLDKVQDFLTKENYEIIDGTSEYRSGKSKLFIKCPNNHEPYWVRISSFQEGVRCRRCANDKLKTSFEEVEVSLIKEGYLILDKDTYKGVKKSRILVKCPKDHEVTINFSDFKNGHKCRLCAIDKSFIPLSEVIERIEKFNYKVIGGKEEYRTTMSHLELECPEKHRYKVIVSNFLVQGNRCPYCARRRSKAELEILEFMRTFDVDVHSERILMGKEIDCYSAKFNFGVEHHGLFWHSTKGNKYDKTYHQTKDKLARDNNIKLYQFFEDEWRDKQEIVKSMIGKAMGQPQQVIYARKCVIKEVSLEDRKLFLNSNHLQGNTAASIAYGLYYNDELVQCISVRKSKYTGSKPFYEVARLATKIGLVVVGGLSKLTKKAFEYVKNNGHIELFSYCDKRYSNGNSYLKAGYTLLGETGPGYYYTDFANRVHRYGMRKTKDCPKGMKEEEWRNSQGWYQIHDAGQFKFVYR